MTANPKRTMHEYLPAYSLVASDRADAWRRANNKTGGFVIMYQGKICCWQDTLSSPSNWQPGSLAVGPSGSQWVATGGDMRAGSEEWTPIRVVH